MAIIDNFKSIKRHMDWIKEGQKGWGPQDEEDDENTAYCMVCNGKGYVKGWECKRCNGTGAPF